MPKQEELPVTDEKVISKILLIRGIKVMIDSDLAELYGIPTKRLNEQVKRNSKRFPDDFMFTLTQKEKDEVVANCDHLINLKFSHHLPNVFTEHGAVMLASVLNSERAIKVNLKIVRIFIKMREVLLTSKDILLKVEQLEKKVGKQDENIQLIFDYLKQFIKEQEQPRNKIGFKQNGSKETSSIE